MSVSGGPNIINSNLIFEFDAANIKSYNYRHNLVTYSQDWTQYLQVSPNASITLYSTTAPDGTATGQKLTTTLGGYGNDAFVQKLYSGSGKVLPTANNLITYSMYVKQGTSPKVTINMGPYNGTQYKDLITTLNWSDLSVTNTGTQYGTNYSGVISVGDGWYRLWQTTDNYFGATDFGYRIYTRDSTANNVTSEYTYFWGAQIEFGGGPPSPYLVTTYPPVLPSNTTIDLSTSKNSGTLANTPYYETSNGAIYFSGYKQANSYISLTNTLPTLSTLSVEVWVNLINNGPNGFGFIIGQNNSVWRLMYSPNSFAWVCATTNNSWYSANTTVSTSGTPTNRWNHLVAVYDGTNHKLYVNGVLSGTSTGIASGNVLSPTGGPNIMLSDAVNMDNGAGRLSVARIYNVALTPDQIIQNFNASRGRYGL